MGYSGSQSNHDSLTSVHPVWPVLTPSNTQCETVESNKQHSLPARQKLPSNINSPSNNAEQLQGRNASDQASRPQTTTPFPFKELAKQGMNIKEIVIRNDMAIPTNPNAEGNGSTIPLKAGDKVMLIQTPKGIYLRMGEKIIKIKLPASLLSSLESPSNDLEDLIPQMAVNKTSKNREQKENDNPTK